MKPLAAGLVKHQWTWWSTDQRFVHYYLILLVVVLSSSPIW